MSNRKTITLSQVLVDTKKDDSCKIVTIPFDLLKEDDLVAFDDALPLGLGMAYWEESTRLALIIIVGKERGVAIEFPPPVQRRGVDAAPDINTESEAYQVLQNLLARSAGEFYAFDMASLSMTLYLEQALRITNAIDIQSAFDVDRYSTVDVLKAALGEEVKIFKENLAAAFDNITHQPSETLRTAVLDHAQRAWLAWYLATDEGSFMTYSDVPRIDTWEMDDSLLDVIAKITSDSQRSENQRPTKTNHDFQYESHDPQNNKHKLKSLTFKNRFRGTTNVRAVVSDPSGSFAATGQVDASGHLAFFTSKGVSIGDRVITSIVGLGREPPTAADKARDRSLLRLLQGLESPENPWIRNIWFNKDPDSIKWPDTWFVNVPKFPHLPPHALAGLSEAAAKLNASQQTVVNTMLSPKPEHTIAIIQGPPGTGKTSVIAFYVRMALALGKKGIWLIAQSNVAVKNIAEKLSEVGFNDYRLLVSDDFIKGWHEHHYVGIPSANVIMSADFKFAGSRIRGCQVMLCTLSMLSSFSIRRIFTPVVPLSTLVIDEASQIHVGDYISIFYKYPSLRKVCFIGDDKQLPPFGQEDASAKGLPSIFEVEHLRKLGLFLNTQYRMPPQIGSLISEAVYDSLLRSNPSHIIPDTIWACHFVDTSGVEKRKDDSYWNEEERDVVIQIATILQNQKKKFKIISPYDGQRTAIENQMKFLGMEWGNTCFNVDSFQGNEEDYIIVSLVRSRELGFLKNLRRTNVMLTRFKQGMFVVSSKKFLNGPGKDCLVGAIAQAVGSGAWLSLEDIKRAKFFGSRT